jgi:hypothetical protein
MNMATRREWLIGQGLAVPGRGKFSKKAHEALDRARLDGVVFDDETPATVEPAGEVDEDGLTIIVPPELASLASTPVPSYV